MEAVLETYDVLLFAPPGLLDKPEVIDKHREEAVSFCYLILAKWIHDVSLYTSTGLGATQIHAVVVVGTSEHQIIVLDPLKGERTLPLQAFSAAWALRHNLAIIVER